MRTSTFGLLAFFSPEQLAEIISWARGLTAYNAQNAYQALHAGRLAPYSVFQLIEPFGVGEMDVNHPNFQDEDNDAMNIVRAVNMIAISGLLNNNEWPEMRRTILSVLNPAGKTSSPMVEWLDNLAKMYIGVNVDASLRGDQSEVTIESSGRIWERLANLAAGLTGKAGANELQEALRDIDWGWTLAGAGRVILTMMRRAKLFDYRGALSLLTGWVSTTMSLQGDIGEPDDATIMAAVKDIQDTLEKAAKLDVITTGDIGAGGIFDSALKGIAAALNSPVGQAIKEGIAAIPVVGPLAKTALELTGKFAPSIANMIAGPAASAAVPSLNVPAPQSTPASVAAAASSPSSDTAPQFTRIKVTRGGRMRDD